MDQESAIYVGTVGHTRVRPRIHKLKYQVFSCLFDCDRLEETSRKLRLFSYNRGNLFSLHDRDFGNGGPIGDYLKQISHDAGMADEIERYSMLCYPRIFGYAFNPLTVYFGYDKAGDVSLIVYEVNNTFGERKTYVIRAGSNENGVIAQECEKEFYVSPFNATEGKYSFHVTPPGEELTVGVALRNQDGPILKAYFRGERHELSDTGLLKGLLRTGWMTVKVTAGIHIEAARLWMKGLRLVPRPPAPESPVTFVNSAETARKT